MANWWYAQNGERRGPVPEEQLRGLVRSGEVSAGDLVWTQGMPQWQPAGTVAQLRRSATSPVPVMPVAAARAMPAKPIAAGAGATCPHCKAANSMLVAYCESCGKAMPGPLPKEPRILNADEIPGSSAAGKLMGDELTKVTKSAATMLLVVAIIQLVIGGLAIVAVNTLSRRPASSGGLIVVGATTIGVGAIFLGLYFWARRSPLPATIVGLVVYSTLILLNIVASVGQMAQNNGQTVGRGFGGIGIGWLDIVIVVILCRGISAALKNRKLMATETI